MRKVLIIFFLAAVAAVAARLAQDGMRTDEERIRLLVDTVIHAAGQRDYVQMLRHVSGARYRDDFHENKNMLFRSLHYMAQAFKAVEVEVLDGPEIAVDGAMDQATATLRAQVLLGYSPDHPPTDPVVQQSRKTDVWHVVFARENGRWYITGVTGAPEVGKGAANR